MLTLSVKVGQGVQVGPDTFVRVEAKSGQQVRLSFATSAAPIKIASDGKVPETLAHHTRRPAP